jgi:hypothetical protein
MQRCVSKTIDATDRYGPANFNPERSGDIFVVFEPHSLLHDADGMPSVISHGSPWRYDTYVPVLRGGSLSAWRIYDVAPTLAAIVGVKPPSGARGVPLVEVLQSQTGSTTVNP